MCKMSVRDDPYASLENVDGDDSLDFVAFANQMCLKAHGDPVSSKTGSYSKILRALEVDDRIPFVSKMGVDNSGNVLLFNFWRDSKNPKGVWRKTTMTSYELKNPRWTTVLDVDELARKEGIPWVWRGSRALSRSRDPESKDGKQVTRVLITLSNGMSDAVAVREFDLLSSKFVSQDAFTIARVKTKASYKSRDVLLVASDFGPRSLTTSGHPRTIREWVRGTPLSDATVVFEGEKTDIAVSSYVDDQRVRGGGIYEVRTRALTLHTNKFFVRKVKFEHLLPDEDPKRAAVGDPPAFKEVEVPDDSEIDFVGNLLMISLHSDWEPEPSKKFSKGSIIYVNAHKFIKYGPLDRIYHILFQSTDRIYCDNYSVTKKFLILTVMDNLKPKLEFYKLEKDANKLRLVGMDKHPQIRAINVRTVDPYQGDEFWLTTSGYAEPTTLWLADASNIDSKDKKVIRKTGSEGYILRKMKATPDQFDASDLEVMQKFAESKDGTRVPYFIVMKKGIKLNKLNPTLLYAYGGFQVTVGPHYVAPTGIAWLERGGVYVEANIRGGGEFGRAWHQAAIRENRYKSIEDFVAVAEDLIASKICKAKTLAIRGGSTGGLLVGNMYVTRPDLFGAVHCACPLLDMKRYNSMSAAGNTLDEFGNPETDDWNKFLKKYSPYHNIDESMKKYPPILFTTNTRDPRVHPGHARKMTKKLWEMGKGKKWPTYLYEMTETSGGPTDDAKQHAFISALAYDFLFSTLSRNAERSSHN